MKKATKWMLAIGMAGMLTGFGTAVHAATTTDEEQQVTEQAPQAAVGQEKSGKAFGHHRGGGLKMGHDQELLTLLKLDEAALREQMTAGKSLAQIAEAQGVTRDQLIAHLKEQQAAHLAEHVAAGKLTQEQADSMTAQIDERLAEQVDRVFDPTMKEGKGFGGQGGAGKVMLGKGFALGQDAELLTLLKLDRAALHEQMQAGKSLAQIAEAQGVTRDQLIAHLKEQQDASLAQAVTDGKLTQEQADSMKTKLADKIEEQVDRTFDPTAKPQGKRGKFGKQQQNGTTTEQPAGQAVQETSV